MDITAITQFIGSVGFPIVCCVGLFWYITKITDQHKEEMNTMRQSLEANTTVLTEIKTFIQAIVGKDKSE